MFIFFFKLLKKEYKTFVKYHLTRLENYQLQLIKRSKVYDRELKLNTRKPIRFISTLFLSSLKVLIVTKKYLQMRL